MCGAAPAAAPIQPLVFEPGMRTHEYVAHSAGGSLRLTNSGIEFAAKDQPLIRLTLAGARRAEPDATDLQVSVSHYFLGNDASKWRTGVPNYGRVS